MKRFREHFEGNMQEWLIILIITAILMLLLIILLPNNCHAIEVAPTQQCSLESCSATDNQSRLMDVRDPKFWDELACNETIIALERGEDAGVKLVENQLNEALSRNKCQVGYKSYGKKFYGYAIVSAGPKDPEKKWRVLTATITMNDKAMKIKMKKVCLDNALITR